MHTSVQTPRRSRAPGFTLVELLVVVSVVAILVLLLLPVLGEVRSAAQRVQCASNLRQMGIAFATFASDHDQHQHPPPPHKLSWRSTSGGRYEPIDSDVVAGSNDVPPGMRQWTTKPGQFFSGRMFPHFLMMGDYIGADGVFDCPSYAGDELPKPSGFPRTDLAYAQNTHTTYRNQHYHTSTDPDTTEKGRKLFFAYRTIRYGRAQNPGRSIMMSDRVMVRGGHWTDNTHLKWNASYGNRDWNGQPDGHAKSVWYHDEGLNVLFYDGGVRFLSRAEAHRARTDESVAIWEISPKPGHPYTAVTY